MASPVLAGNYLLTVDMNGTGICYESLTGKELWKWNPAQERSGRGRPRQRGLVYWENSSGGERRLFTGVGGYLFALDPKNGSVIREFGENGSIALGSGLNTPGVIYKDLLVVGGVGGAGAVRAYDVRTGKRRWIFHLIPRPWH